MNAPAQLEKTSPSANAPETDGCFHCGLPLAGSDLSIRIDGREEGVCCAGCQAVANAIIDSGNSDYYRFRDRSAGTANEVLPEFLSRIKVYDHPSVQRQFVHRAEENLKEVSLIIEGIVCAACIWLNEQYLRGLPGVVSVQINYSTHRAQIRWHDDEIQLSGILEAISRIGYLAHPYDPATQQQLYENQRKDLIRRIGIAGLFGMQAMMFALALYGGDWWGISDSFHSFFRWISLLVTLPIIGYSARPFYRGAWKDLSVWRAGMDVPIVLGLSLAFAASAWNTWTGKHDVYFDSVAMFVFLVLSVRLFELSARKKAAEKIESMTNLTPTMTRRIAADGEIEMIPTVELEPSDRFLVKPGELIPTDGVLLSPLALVDEALLTGEQLPLHKSAGDVLVGGSYNLEQPVELKVHRLGQDTVLSGIKRLIEQAQGFKPEVAKLADKVASVFVGAILLLVTGAGIYWWQVDPERLLPVVVATLVVTCPCALSLATPASLSSAIGALTRNGMLVANSQAMEVMPRIDTVVFDKTGTLTSGTLSLVEQVDSNPVEQQRNRLIAHSLELHSEHPVARALVLADTPAFEVQGRLNSPGAGIQGIIDGEMHYLGNAEFVSQHAPLPEQSESDALQIVYLVREGQWLASFSFSDPLKPDARQTIETLQKHGIEVRILSGDRKAYVATIARQLGVEHFDAEQLPDDKLRCLKALQKEGRRVAMAGDGINDAPVLAAADLSISLSLGTDLARASADLVINGALLQPVSNALLITRKMMRIIRQNFAWAIGYNIVAVPFSLAGLIPPWLAAIGMSLSSLVVVVNALRLR